MASMKVFSVPLPETEIIHDASKCTLCLTGQFTATFSNTQSTLLFNCEYDPFCGKRAIAVQPIGGNDANGDALRQRRCPAHLDPTLWCKTVHSMSVMHQPKGVVPILDKVQADKMREDKLNAQTDSTFWTRFCKPFTGRNDGVAGSCCIHCGGPPVWVYCDNFPDTKACAWILCNKNHGDCTPYTLGRSFLKSDG
jgi:hypothetical protein